MPLASADLGVADAVNITADALAAVTEQNAGRSMEPGADLAAAPSVAVEPGAPWAAFRTVGRCLTVSWRVRIVVARWTSDAGLGAAVATYTAAAPGLRRAGFSVGTLDAPAVADIGGVPYLVATFTVFLDLKASP